MQGLSLKGGVSTLIILLFLLTNDTIHKWKHACIHTYIHACMHTFVCFCIYTGKYMHMCAGCGVGWGVCARIVEASSCDGVGYGHTASWKDWPNFTDVNCPNWCEIQKADRLTHHRYCKISWMVEKPYLTMQFKLMKPRGNSPNKSKNPDAGVHMIYGLIQTIKRRKWNVFPKVYNQYIKQRKISYFRNKRNTFMTDCPTRAGALAKFRSVMLLVSGCFSPSPLFQPSEVTAQWQGRAAHIGWNSCMLHVILLEHNFSWK